MSKKIALVTGGSQGIGEAICKRLAADGFFVIVASRSQAKVDAVADSIKEAGGEALGLSLDVSDVASFKDVIKSVTQEHGGIHVLVNNAGVTKDNLMMRIKEDDYDGVLGTNLRGPFFLCQAVLRPMLRQKWGRIINITSVVGLMGNAGQTNYAASKAGLVGMTKSLAREISAKGITCNAIAPGYIETPMTEVLTGSVTDEFMKQIPCGRMGRPQEVANAVGFLAGDEASYITGQVLSVDGGLYM